MGDKKQVLKCCTCTGKKGEGCTLVVDYSELNTMPTYCPYELDTVKWEEENE